MFNLDGFHSETTEDTNEELKQEIVGEIAEQLEENLEAIQKDLRLLKIMTHGKENAKFNKIFSRLNKEISKINVKLG